MTLEVALMDERYQIQIGRGLLLGCGEKIREVCGGARALLVTDENVMGLYAQAVLGGLSAAGYQVDKVVLPPGETSKSFLSIERMCEGAARLALTRSDVVVALGGGVVGDAAGLFAALWQRGTPVVQIPTTLLSQIDSSVGGKVAIDIPQGKNLLGQFYQPRLVVCDLDVLSTLDDVQFGCGLAEAVKYGVIADAGLFEMIADCQNRAELMEHIEEIVVRCLKVKRDVVMRDPFDKGERMVLNFGHTFGHGIEALSEYQVPHGMAVAMGMAMMARASVAFCGADRKAAERLTGVLTRHNLPVQSPYPADRLLPYIARDKKATSSGAWLVGFCEIGRVQLVKVDKAQVGDWLLEGCR